MSRPVSVSSADAACDRDRAAWSGRYVLACKHSVYDLRAEAGTLECSHCGRPLQLAPVPR